MKKPSRSNEVYRSNGNLYCYRVQRAGTKVRGMEIHCTLSELTLVGKHEMQELSGRKFGRDHSSFEGRVFATLSCPPEENGVSKGKEGQLDTF